MGIFDKVHWDEMKQCANMMLSNNDKQLECHNLITHRF